VDVTIVYPKGVPTFTDLLTGRIEDIVVTVRQQPIPKHLLVNAEGRPADRSKVQAWINGLWQVKDAEIAQILAGAQASGQRPGQRVACGAEAAEAADVACAACSACSGARRRSKSRGATYCSSSLPSLSRMTSRPLSG